MQVTEIQYTDLYKSALLAFVHEEASKLLNRWQFFEFEITLNLPPLVDKILRKYPNLFLSGSAVCVKQPKDYDLFIVGEEGDVLNDFRKLSKTSGYERVVIVCENSYCLSAEIDGRLIQVVKRVYKNASLIAANFDLSIVRSIYRPGQYWTSILNLFEIQKNTMFINMKNNSKMFFCRIMKYREYRLSFCVFEKKFIKARKEKNYIYQTKRKKCSSVVNIIKGKFDKTYIYNGEIRDANEYLSAVNKKHGSFYTIFKTDAQNGTYVHKGIEYYFKREDTLQIVTDLFMENYKKMPDILRPQYVDRYVGPVYPLAPEYVMHRPANIFAAFPEFLIILKSKLPKFIRVLIIWYLSAALIIDSFGEFSTSMLIGIEKKFTY